MASVGSEYLWRQMGQTCQNNAYGILLRKLTRTLGVTATRANARMRLRVLGTSVGRRGDSQYNRTAREEARFREAEWDNYNRHGPRGHAQYHIPPRIIRALYLKNIRALPTRSYFYSTPY